MSTVSIISSFKGFEGFEGFEENTLRLTEVKVKSSQTQKIKKDKPNRKISYDDKVIERKALKRGKVLQRNKNKIKEDRYITYDTRSKMVELSF